MALAQKHWALITDACGITTAATFAVGVAVQHMTGSATGTTLLAIVLTGAAVLVVTLALHGSLHIAGAVAMWTALSLGWVTYAHLHGHVWSMGTWQWLALPAIALTAWSAIAGHRHISRLDDIDRRRRGDLAELAQWDDLLTGCGIEGVHAVKQWRTERGRAIKLVLPTNGRVTKRSLQSAVDGIAAALRIRAGALTFQTGKHEGEVIMRIDDNDAMARDIVYPDDPAPLTINKPFPIGTQPSGRPGLIHGNMTTLTTGVTGSGKTNSLHVKIAQYVRCPDCIVIVVDLKGGRLVAPWIRPWVEGRCPRPAIDWAATTRAEAWLVYEAVDDLITMRGSTLAGGVAKFHATPHLPHFVVITDEMADVTGDLPRDSWDGVKPSDLAALTAKSTRKGRSEGVSFDWATQKGTVDFTGSSAIKSQCKQRVSLATASESDARSVTDNNAVVRLLASAPYVGSLVIESPTQRDAILTKGWRLDGDDDAALIDTLAVRAGMTRPSPDPVALAAFAVREPDRYTARWDRSELYQLLLEDWHRRTGAAPLPAPPTAPANPASAPPSGAAAVVAEMDVNQEAAALLGSIGIGGHKPDPVGRMWALLADHRAIGMTVIEITWTLEREGLSVHRSTLYRHLTRGEQDGKVRRTGGEGERARWLLTD